MWEQGTTREEERCDMSATTTAEVVTLEASVRVLQVGNRQITQSVAKQLDKVEPWRLDVMGRVKIGADEFAIGRDLDSGDLALAAEHLCEVHYRRVAGVPRPTREEISPAWFSGEVEISADYSREVDDKGRTRQWKLEQWWVVTDPSHFLAVDEPCPCCLGCSFQRTGRYTLSTEVTHYEFPRDIQSYKHREVLEAAIDMGRDEVTITGKALVHASQRHTGSGNRYSRKWVQSLPLIVLAGLR